MKATFNITIPEVTTTVQGTEVAVQKGGHIGIEVDYTLAEMKGLYELQKEALAELPALLRAFAVEVCKEAVVAKRDCTAELMKDEDFRKQRERDQEQARQAEERFDRLRRIIRSSFNSDECNTRNDN